MESTICLCFWFVTIYCLIWHAQDYIYANPRIEEKDLIIIGGGVAGYVAAIKAGQEGMKVRES
jgi:NADPH-dependent 2,4-dienoyl-CoA reductase/sulfur reductase-like enzyme